MVNEIMASSQIGYPILSVLLLFPVLLAVAIGMIKDDAMARQVALYGALAELALAVYLVFQFIPGSADIQFAEKNLWLPTLGDGRQSGTSDSPSILNASPESAVGGGLV